MKAVARSYGLGRLAYHSWYRPLGMVREMIAAGGPLEQLRTASGRRGMERAARTLPPPPSFSGRSLELHVLSGRRCWYQTAFCLWTFCQHSRLPLSPVIYDDGTLTADYVEPLRRLFPAARFVSQEMSRNMLETSLPEARFPVLHERWRNYLNIRKLLDVHVGQTGWKLVVDSDLLFFRRPSLLIDWIDEPVRPLHAVDCETSYGYSTELMEELASARVADRINVGLTGLEGGSLDWERIEYICRTLIAREGRSYYLEQALIAILMAGCECTVAPEVDYVTLPVQPEAVECSAVMHHYVANSKPAYFRRNWRRATAVSS